MKNVFAEAVIGFLCVIQEDGRVTGSFLACLELKYREMAAVVEVSCSETPFDSSVFSFSYNTNYDTFAKVLIIMNGLLFFNCCLVECK